MNYRTMETTYKGRHWSIPEAWVMGFREGARSRGEPDTITDAIAWWVYQEELKELEERV